MEQWTKIKNRKVIIIRQIEEKGYAEPLAYDSRKLIKLAVNFSSETRNIQDWKVV